MASFVLIMALLNILFGVLVLVLPGFLRFIVGSYFVISGILMLLFL